MTQVLLQVSRLMIGFNSLVYFEINLNLGDYYFLIHRNYISKEDFVSCNILRIVFSSDSYMRWDNFFQKVQWVLYRMVSGNILDNI